MEVIRIVVALLLPWAAGFFWLTAVSARCANPVPWLIRAGYAYPLGMFGTALLMQLLDAVGAGLHFRTIAGSLAGVAVLGMAYARSAPAGGIPASKYRSEGPGSRWARVAFYVLAALVLGRIVAIALEIVWRPLFPWDAWAGWAVRAHIWFDQTAITPISTNAAHDLSGYHAAGVNHPQTISLLQTWFALAKGAWDDSIINLPWLGLTVAFLAALYGQARAYGLSALAAIAIAYLTISLPLFHAHAALAGYADLWISVAFSMGIIALAGWSDSRDRAQLLLALLCTAMLFGLKEYGYVFALAFLPALVIGTANRRLIAAGVTTLVAVAGYLALGGTLALPPLGMEIGPERVVLPALGQVDPGEMAMPWRDIGADYFVWGSWHILWYAFPVVLIVAPLMGGGRRTYAVMAVSGATILMLMLAALLASDDLIDLHTVTNRTSLAVAPLVCFLLVALLERMAGQQVRRGVVADANQGTW